MNNYKYSTPPDDMDIVYLLVVSELVWNCEGDFVKDTVPLSLKGKIPNVGDITWVSRHNLYDRDTKEISLDVSSVHIERNRFGSNIDPSCFEILHTSKQKIRK
jgi:hypothetical protein